MSIELTLRDAIRLQTLLAQSVQVLRDVNDANYPNRNDDILLLAKLQPATDAHWNK